MKKQIKSAISKLTLASVFFVTLGSTHAQATGLVPVVKNTEIKYVGVTSESILFNVSVDNPNGTKFSVIVLDDEGNQLFQEVYTDKKFDKRFKLPKDDKNKVTFIIRNFKDADEKQVFEVNTRIVEDVVVTKIG